VTWVAPTVGDGPSVTGYTLYERVTYSMSDVAASSGVPSTVLQTMLSEDTDTVVVDTVAYDGSSSTAVSTSLSGLSGGVSYDYVVAARSAAGEGERSTALSVSTSPPAPGSLDSVSQTTSSITLSWSAPVVTTGSAVTGYNVYIDDGSSGTPGSVPVSCGVADALSTTCTASGLTGGVSYSFEVSALSTTGESDRSSVSAMSTAPAAVAGSMAFSSVTTTSMDLAWTAPSGATPTGYIVYRDDGDSATPSIVVFEGDALTATASGLTGGTSYSYTVAALSAAGVGDVSGVSTQSTSPAAPLGLSSVTQTSTSITLSWSASVEASGGSAVTSYKVYRNDGSSASAALSSSAAHTTADGTTTSATLSDLSAGLLYSFAVSAVSAAGEGDQSSVLAQSSSPGAPASGPTSLHQTSTSISLDWSAPASDGLSGEDASGYRLYNVAGTSAVLLYAGPETAYEQVGLTASTSYEYAVSAVSDAGESPSTSPLVQSTAPGAVSSLISTHQSSTTIMLDWDAPSASASGQAVTGYRVYQRVVHELNDLMGGDVPDAVLAHFFGDVFDEYVVWSEDTLVYDGADDTVTAVEVSTLTGGTLYEFVVAPLSLAGEGAKGTSVVQSTAPAAPGTPSAFGATTSSITVGVPNVAVVSGQAVTSYRVYRDDGLGGTSSPSVLAGSADAAADGAETNVDLQALAAGRTYRLAAVAVSAAGESPLSTVISASTLSP